jgi:hypothetical protein
MRIRFPLFIVGCVFTATPLSQAQETLAISRLSVSDEQVHLQWEGGASPFSVEYSQDLAAWTRLLQTMDSSTSLPKPESVAGFYRVVSGEPVSVDYLGQLRVDEGEFGDPLARHRLKSFWDFYLPVDGETSKIPEEFFKQLTLRLVYRDGIGLASFIGKFEDLPLSNISSSSNEMNVTWSFGEGDAKRDYVLKLAFPYSIRTSRTSINLSDPRYTLTCRYATPQPKEGFEQGGGLVIEETKEDEVSLYQISEEPVAAWLNRNHSFEVGEASVSTKYVLGLPMLEGRPAFIWKTPVLDKWNTGTIVSGLTTEPLEISDRFTQTYQPGHHNFWEVFWIEPSLLPGISTRTIEELQTADIRFIIATHPTSFPTHNPTIQIVGFDLKVREL